MDRGMAYLCLATQLKSMKAVILFKYPNLNKSAVLLFLIFYAFLAFSQLDSNQLNKSRKNAVLLSTAGVYTGTLIALNQLWYADYERSELHSFDDSDEWLQMDKIGHVYSSYLGGSLAYKAFKYAGISEKKSLIFGGSMGFIFLSTVEIMDGYSENWGFSWSDLLSNGIGAGLFIGQQAAWGRQIISMKYSYSASKYRQQNPNLLGDDWNEAIIKDYNAQTIWFSASLSDLGFNSIPPYLSLALGYGADGMINANGTSDINGNQVKGQRQYYCSLDLNLSKIKTENKTWNTVFYLLNFIKVPSPTLEVNKQGNTTFHWLFF